MNTNSQTLKLDHPGDKDAYYGKKPEQVKQPNGTFRFSAIVEFEIDSDTAANLLVESHPGDTIGRWLSTQQPIGAGLTSCNAENLRTAHGLYLSDKAISKARLLLPEGTPAIPPF